MAVKFLHRFGLPLLCMSLLLITLRVAAVETESAGQVIIATGEVFALATDGAQRTLTRRSPFYAGETIRTAATASVQLRFSDGALMSLREDTELKVDSYRFQNQGGKGDRSMSTLIKGGLRTITGVIGKQDADAYRVSTPVATIGVRGTHYEAVMESPNSLVLAAWQGSIQVRNDRGELDLGAGGDFNFGRVEVQQSPQGLLEPPKVLQALTPVGSRRAPPQSGTQTAAAAQTSEDVAVAEAQSETSDKPATELQASGEIKPRLPGNSGFPENPMPFLAEDSCSNCVPPQQILVTNTTDLPQSADLRFTPLEWNNIKTTPFLGLAVEANNSAAYGFKGGRALNHGTNSPVITDNGYGPHEPQYATAPIQAVIRQSAAAADAFSSHSVDAAHTLYWGTWNGSVNPVEIQIDATNPAVKQLVNAPVHWATLLPTDNAVMASRTGNISLSSVVVAHGGGSGGGPLTPGNLTFNANVNFNTGAITAGTLGINNGPETWNVNFAGQVRGNIFDAQVNTVTSTVMVSPSPTQSVEGDLGMAFTGNTGQAVGGVFNFQAIGNPATHVEGVLLVQ